MLGKVFIGIIALMLLLGAFLSPIQNGIKGWRTTDTTQNFVVATGGGITSSNVTLAHDLYRADVTEVIAVTSNNTGDAPIAISYSEDDLKLLVAGLAASDSRNISVEYYAETDETVMRALGPFLGFLIIGGLVFGIAHGIFHKGR